MKSQFTSLLVLYFGVISCTNNDSFLGQYYRHDTGDILFKIQSDSTILFNNSEDIEKYIVLKNTSGWLNEKYLTRFEEDDVVANYDILVERIIGVKDWGKNINWILKLKGEDSFIVGVKPGNSSKDHVFSTPYVIIDANGNSLKFFNLQKLNEN